MPRIPKHQASASVNSGSTAAFQAPLDKSSGLTVLSRGLGSLGSTLAGEAADRITVKSRIDAIKKRQKDAMDVLAERNRKQDNALEVATKYSQLRTDWSKRLIEYTQDPSEQQIVVAGEEYDAYVSDLLKDVKSDDVRQELELRASDYRIGLIGKAHGIQAATRAANFGGAFATAYTNAEDSIANTQDFNEFMTQKIILNELISSAEATGRIQDKDTIQKLRNDVDQLALSYAETIVGDRPEEVLSMLSETDAFNGVTAAHRATMKRKAKAVIESKKEIDKFKLREQVNDHHSKLLQSGSGTAPFTQAQLEEAFGESQAATLQRSFLNASKAFHAKEQMTGRSLEDIENIVAKFKPNADSDHFEEKNLLYRQILQTAGEVKREKDTDPFKHFVQRPDIRPFLDKAEKTNNPEDINVVRELVLKAQREDASIAPYDYKVMDQASAKNFIAEFNKGLAVGSELEGPGVFSMISTFMEDFGENVDIALMQLKDTTGGEQVSPLINPLSWHLNNPSTFESILSSVRKDDTEENKRFEDSAVKTEFFSQVFNHGDWQKYQNSIRATRDDQDGAFLIKGVQKAFTSFARDYTFNGGSVKEAGNTFFEPYTFTEVNGVHLMRPRVYTNEEGALVPMSEEQIETSDAFFEWYQFTIDPNTIDPDFIDITEGLGAEFEMEQIQDQLEENAFWALDEKEEGAYLYAKGPAGLGAPRQVFLRSGEPIHATFKQSLVSIPMVRFGVDPAVTPGLETGDSWWEGFLKNLSFGSGKGGLNR